MAIYSGFSHWKWWFSIVMLVYQRVTRSHFHQSNEHRSKVGDISDSVILLPPGDMFPWIQWSPNLLGKSADWGPISGGLTDVKSTSVMRNHKSCPKIFFLLIFLDQSKFLNHTSWFGFLPIFPHHSIHSRGPALRSDTSPWSKLRAKAMQAPLGMGCGFDGIIYHKS